MDSINDLVDDAMTEAERSGKHNRAIERAIFLRLIEVRVLLARVANTPLDDRALAADVDLQIRLINDVLGFDPMPSRATALPRG
jgi:hypothetical protein